MWLKQPLVSLEDIQQRHDIVDALVEDPLLRERLRNLHLRGAHASSYWICSRTSCACVAAQLSADETQISHEKCGVWQGCSEHELSAHAGLPDVERLARKLDRRKASLADLCQLYRASSRLPMLVEAFRDYEGPHTEILITRCNLNLSQKSIFWMSMDCNLWLPHCPLPTKHHGLIQLPDPCISGHGCS